MVSQQSVLVDGIPDHLHDLHPALETGHSLTSESDESSGDVLLMDCASGLLENVTTSSLDDSEVETVVHVPLRPKDHPCPAFCVIIRSGENVIAIMLTCDEKGLGSCCMSSVRDSKLNQKQTTYRRERECPFFFIHSFDWFWHYVAKCPSGWALA